MEHVRIFSGNAAQCSSSINKWLAEHAGAGLVITRALQSSETVVSDNGIGNEMIHITIFYEDKEVIK